MSFCVTGLPLRVILGFDENSYLSWSPSFVSKVTTFEEILLRYPSRTFSSFSSSFSSDALSSFIMTDTTTPPDVVTVTLSPTLMSLYVFVEPSRVITGVEAFTTKFVTVPLVESL